MLVRTTKYYSSTTLYYKVVLHTTNHTLYYKVTLVIDPRYIWKVIYTARRNRSRPPTPPNIAPATKNNSHDWSVSLCVRHETSFPMREATGPTLQSHQIVCLPTKNDAQDWSLSHMKRHLKCAEQQKSPSNVTKHCGCHEKWPSKIRQKFAENSWNVIYTDQSPSVRNPHATSIDTRTSPYTAPTTKSDTWISRNTVPGTESDSWTWPNHAMSFVYRKFLHLNFLRTFLLFASKLSRRVISEKNQRASYSSQFSASHPRHFPTILRKHMRKTHQKKTINKQNPG